MEKTGETTQLQIGNPGLKFPVATGQLKSVWAWKPASPSRSQGPKDKRRIRMQDGSYDGRRLPTTSYQEVLKGVIGTS